MASVESLGLPAGRVVILGLGVSGLSAAKFLSRYDDIELFVCDSREQPARAETLFQTCPDVTLRTGAFDESFLASANWIVISPGLDPDLPVFNKAKEAGVPFLGDVALFMRAVDKPVVGITGSNGKSTVTTWVGHILSQAAWSVGVGGNLGTPALDLLNTDHHAYVLELSSFQLDVMDVFGLDIAVILNISPDHLERYPSFQRYVESKQCIYVNARTAIFNRHDLSTLPREDVPAQMTFGLDTPESDSDIGLCLEDGVQSLSVGRQAILPVEKLSLKGRHNLENAMATYAITRALGLDDAEILPGLQNFDGLPHRCQFVREHQGVFWINDSKGTNTGATLAAINGFSDISGRIVLILGGQGKGEDYGVLRSAIQQHCRAVVLMGENRFELEETLADIIAFEMAESMASAVAAANRLAQPGDYVLMSPAAASMDQFQHFMERGAQFMALVERLPNDR